MIVKDLPTAGSTRSFGIMNWTERSLNWGVHGADEAGVTKVRRSGAARAALRTGMLRVGTLRERALRTGMLRGGRRTRRAQEEAGRGGKD